MDLRNWFGDLSSALNEIMNNLVIIFLIMKKMFIVFVNIIRDIERGFECCDALYVIIKTS